MRRILAVISLGILWGIAWTGLGALAGAQSLFVRPPSEQRVRDLVFGNIHVVIVGLLLWAYAYYALWQARRHRAPFATDVRVSTFRFPPLTARGAAYRKRFWWAAILGLLTVLVGMMTLPF